MSDPEIGAEPEADDLAQLAELPVPPDTGDDAVDAATAALTIAIHEPLDVQAQAFEQAHRALQDRLADVES